MSINFLVETATVLAIFTIVLNVISIVMSLFDSRKYFHANSGIKNCSFPSKEGFSNEDLTTSQQFSGKFRGSVRLGSSRVFTDEQIEEKRKKASKPLP